MNGTLKALLVPFIVGTLALLTLETLVRPRPRVRNVEVFTEMAYSRAGESFSPSTVLPGGRTQQPVPAGVVVRGQRPFRYGPGPEEAQRAGAELVNPYADDDSVLERGAAVYRVFCGLCHGGDGNGRGPVTERGMPPPPSLLGARARAMADGEMFHVLTLGQGNMGSYAAQVTPEDRWKVVRHVRALQEASR